VVAAGLTGVPTVTLAKAEHRHSWLERLIQHSFAYPGAKDPQVITYFDREDCSDLPRIVEDLGRRIVGGQSVMVHIEGTRALTCRAPLVKMSGIFLDLALETGTPVVPVRFVGGGFVPDPTYPDC
jgi:hypothetical protein